MATRRASATAQRGPQSPQSHGIKKHSPSYGKTTLGEVRRSARLRAISQPEGSSRGKQPEKGLTLADEASSDQAQLSAPNKPSLKRKRSPEASHPSLPAEDPLPQEIETHIDIDTAGAEPIQNLVNPTDTTAADPVQNWVNPTDATVADPIQNWVLNDTWPREYFEPNDQAELFERDSWQEDYMAQPSPPVVQYVERNGFRLPLPIKKTPSSLRRKQSESSLTESVDQKNREGKNTPYRDRHYATLLAAKGSYMDESALGITNTSLSSYETLLSSDQTVPQDSLFRDDLFGSLCQKVRERNEAMIVSDLTRLLVPSAMNLAIRGNKHLDVLMENVNEGWTSSIPIQGPRPQPDYSVGFQRSAFTEEQLNKLDPLIGSVFDTSFFVATFRMYFPFLTCEVKGRAADLDVADLQNAHSMSLAVRGVIELYRAVEREKELDGEILAFSISHNARMVRIYGHYALTNNSRTTFHRHLIKEFSFVSQRGADKWTAYKFTKNVYDIWMPMHLKRICSAVEQLPALDFQVPYEPAGQSEEGTGLSQGVESLLSDVDFASQGGQEHDAPDPAVPQTATPDNSVSIETMQGAAKKAKKTHPTEKSKGTRK